MNTSWLAVINKALAAAGGLRKYGEYVVKVIRRLFLVDQKVDREEIQNLAAYIKVFDAYAKSMQRAGATQSEIRAAMGELLTPKLRAYLLVRGIVEVERRRSGGLSLEADGTESNIAGPCDKAKPSPHVERRVMHLAPDGDGRLNKRIGDLGRDR